MTSLLSLSCASLLWMIFNPDSRIGFPSRPWTWFITGNCCVVWILGWTRLPSRSVLLSMVGWWALLVVGSLLHCLPSGSSPALSAPWHLQISLTSVWKDCKWSCIIHLFVSTWIQPLWSALWWSGRKLAQESPGQESPQSVFHHRTWGNLPSILKSINIHAKDINIPAEWTGLVSRSHQMR